MVAAEIDGAVARAVVTMNSPGLPDVWARPPAMRHARARAACKSCARLFRGLPYSPGASTLPCSR